MSWLFLYNYPVRDPEQYDQHVWDWYFWREITNALLDNRTSKTRSTY